MNAVKIVSRTIVVVVGILCAVVLLAAGQTGADSPRSLDGALSPFVENRGQTDPSILFYSDNDWGRLCVRGSDIVFQLLEGARVRNVYVDFPEGRFVHPCGKGGPVTRLSYFRGTDSSGWVADVPVYEEIVVEDFHGGEALRISAGKGGRGTLALAGAPVPQELCRIDAGEEISARAVAEYLKQVPLEGKEDVRSESQSILWATFIGGNNDDWAFDSAVSPDGGIVVTGGAESSDMPVPNGYDQTVASSNYEDIYVAKLTADGTQLLWGTYIGGDFEDRGYSLAFDGEGNVIVGGKGAKNCPTPGGYLTTISGNGIYIAKLSSSGSSLLWGTYVANGACYKILAGASGEVYFGAETDHDDAPCPGGYDTTYAGGSSDLYFGKLSATGNQVLWGSYLGGGNDDCLTDEYLGCFIGMALASDGGLIIGTSVHSSDIPLLNGYDNLYKGSWEFYLAKFAPGGASLSWATYLGGTKEDWFGDLALDNSGNIVMAGASRSLDCPALGGYQPAHKGDYYYDGYVAKLSSSGSALLWGTYLGGSNDDYLYSVELDGGGNVMVAGETVSDDCPLANALDSTRNGSKDIYYAIISSGGGSLLEASYLGGSQSDSSGGLSFDGEAAVYIAGYSFSSNIPVGGSVDSTRSSLKDIYLAKVSLSAITACVLSCGATVPAFASPNESVSFSGQGGANPAGCTTPSYDWDFGDGTAHFTSQNATHKYTAENSYTWRLTVSGAGANPCVKSGTITVTSSQCRITCEASSAETGLINLPVEFTASSSADGCSQAVSYNWEFGDGQFSSSQNPSHAYATAGTYGWTMTVSADSIDCVKSGTIEILAQRPCLTVGGIRLCANSIVESGSTYTLSGNVSANDILFFTEEVTYTRLTSGSGNLFTNGDIFVPNINGHDQTMVEGPGTTYIVNGGDMSFTPTYAPLLYALQLAGVPMAVGGTGIRLDSEGAVIEPFLDIGAGQLVLAKVQVEIKVVPGGGIWLTSAQVTEGSITPSITIGSITLSYDPPTDTMSGSVGIAFPFLGAPSVSASIEVVAGCFNGFSITVGLPAGIPLGQSGLEIVGFTLEVDNICDLARFYIFIGGDVGIVGVPSEVLVIQHAGLGYQFPFTLEIDGGSLSFLGYPLSSMGGTIVVYPPCVSAYGDTNIAGIYTTHVSVTLDISNLLISGSASGSLQIPDWSCCTTCFFCKAVKAGVILVLGDLPYTFAGADMGVSIGQVREGEWGGSMRGNLTVANRSVAAEISFLNGDIDLSVGRNYNNLYEVWLRNERALSPLGYEKTLAIPSQQERVTFAASGNSETPEIYLVTPTGERLTRDNYSSYPGAVYMESAANQTSLFEIAPAASGNWTFGMNNINEGDGDLFALGIRSRPTVTFESVAPSSKGYSIKMKVTPASEETTVSLYFTDSPEFSNGLMISRDLTPLGGVYTAEWLTADVPNGNYMIFAKADDGVSPVEAVYYASQVAVNRDAIQPPTGLSGTTTADGALLSWTASVSQGVAGYTVLYTDEPDILGYKFRWGTAEKDKALVTGLDSQKSYRFAVAAYDVEGNFSLESNAVTLSFLPPPVVTSMAKLGSPFRINVTGSNLRQGIQVFVNGTLWSNVKWKSTGNIKIKGGASLKALVPKGVDATFRFVNPDGGERGYTWRY